MVLKGLMMNESELFNRFDSISEESNKQISKKRTKYIKKNDILSEKRISKIQDVGSLFNKLIDELGLRSRIDLCQALLLWDQVVGEGIAGVTYAKSIDNGKLLVKVKDASWRNELSYLKLEIIENLNDRIGKKVVIDIIFY